MLNRRDFMKWLGFVPAAPLVFSIGGGVWVPPAGAVEVVDGSEMVYAVEKVLTAQDRWLQYVNDFNEVMGIRA